MTRRIGSLILAAMVAAGSTPLDAQAPLASPPAPSTRAKPTPAPPAFFEGTVLGPDAKPIAEAVIVVSAPGDPDPPLVARTGADGRFRVQARRRGPHAVRVEARGLAAQNIEKAMPGTPLRVTLAKGGSIEGVVRDADSGKPVADARIEAREESRSAAPLWEPGVGVVAAQADARGAFRIDGLARGRHTVTASSRTAGRATQSGVALGQRLELLLVAGPSIAGRVLTPDGKPAAGAAVRTEPEIGPGQLRLVGADAAGRFEIAGLTSGAYRLIAHHEDWAVGIMGGVRADRGVDVDVDIVLTAPARVTGRLVDADERPLAGTVSLQEIDGQASPRSLGALVRAEAGADGRFTLERVPPGSHALAVAGRGVAPRRVAIDVGARQKTVDLGDVVLEAGAQIRGRVRDKAGAPIADAVVRASADGPPTPGVLPLEGRTEADGTFALGGATGPAYRLYVQAAGFAPMLHPVEAPSAGVEIVLEAAGAIAGLVVDEAGRPVESFEVGAAPSGGREAMQRQFPRTRSITSDAGRFTLDDLAPGAYALQVTGRDLGRQLVSDVKVAAGAVTDVGRIRLASGGALRGTVLDASSVPVVGATVEARGSDRPMMTSSDFQQATTDGGGGFHLRGLPTGTVVVIARHPEFAEGRSAPIDIDPGRTAETSVVLTRGGRIEGVVRRRGGATLPDLWIGVQPMAPPASFSMPPSVNPGPDGRFVIDHVSPGRVHVSLRTRSSGGMGTGQSKEIEVHEGETAAVEFVWRDILLTGKVTRGGAPLPNVRLTAWGGASSTFYGSSGGRIPAPSPGPQRMTAVTREDGSYEMIVGEAGQLTIRAEPVVGRSSYPVRTITVADADSQTVDLDYPAGGISGIVVDDETEAPIARAHVAALPGKPGGPVGGQATTGPDGRFRLEIDPGAFRLRVSAEEHATDTIDVTVGEPPGGEVRVALSRGARLRGRVVDGQGRPAPGVWVMAREDGEEGIGASETSSLDGSFEFSALRPGSYSLAGGSALSGFGIVTGVSPGAAGVVLRLSPGGRIRISATEGNETPVEGAFISVRRVNGMRFNFPGSSGRTASDGTAEFDSPAGLIEIEVRKGTLTGRGQATVASGGLAALEVTLAEETTPPAP